MYKEIRLKRGKEESLRRFHPWVFSGAILKIDEGVGEGDVVRVLAIRAISSLSVTTRRALLQSVCCLSLTCRLTMNSGILVSRRP